MTSQFVEIEILNLKHVREEVDILRAEVCSLTKSHMTVIPPIIALVVQTSPLYDPNFFYLFVEDDVTISVVGIKRG